jgi:hypothetical protein
MLRKFSSALGLVVAIWLLPSLAFCDDAPVGNEPEQPNIISNARIEETPEAKASALAVSYGSPRVVKTLSIDPQEKPSLAPYKQGDVVEIRVDNPKSPTKILSVDFKRQYVSAMTAALTAGGCALALLLILWFVMRANPLLLLIGADNRFSKSKTQLAFWGLTVISVYLGAVVLRICYLGDGFVGGVEIPANLLLLSGFSAFSFGAAKAITASKAKPIVGEPVTLAKANAIDAEPRPDYRSLRQFFDDLVKDDKGNFDLGDTQMILITVIAIVIFTVDGVYFLLSLPYQAYVTLPDVDTTLLSAFGLGQGAYLLKKAAGDPKSN